MARITGFPGSALSPAGAGHAAQLHDESWLMKKPLLVAVLLVLLWPLWVFIGKPSVAGRGVGLADPGHVMLPQPAERVPPDGTARILVVGDTYFGESYRKWMPRVGNVDLLTAKGYDHGFRNLTPLLEQGDVVVANLEAPITDLISLRAWWTDKYIHGGDRHLTPATLQRHGIRAVSLANNHAWDHGLPGLRQTMAALNANGIAWCGAGLTAAQAARPLAGALPVGGNSLPVLITAGYEDRRLSPARPACYAAENTAGVNGWTPREAGRQIAAARTAHPHALIVAFPHWGYNYRLVTSGQTAIAHALIEAGADLVIGHGAHLVQAVESYRGRWILYSLGNFVFNAPGRYQKLQVPPYSLAALLELTGEEGRPRLRLQLYPLHSDNLVTGYQPRLVMEQECQQVYQILLRTSPQPELLEQELRIERDAVGWRLALEVGGLDHLAWAGEANRVAHPHNYDMVDARKELAE